MSTSYQTLSSQKPDIILIFPSRNNGQLNYNKLQSDNGVIHKGLKYIN